MKKLGMIFDQAEGDQAGESTPAAAKGKEKKKPKKGAKEQRWSGRFDASFVSQTAEKMAELK